MVVDAEERLHNKQCDNDHAENSMRVIKPQTREIRQLDTQPEANEERAETDELQGAVHDGVSTQAHEHCSEGEEQHDCDAHYYTVGFLIGRYV